MSKISMVMFDLSGTTVYDDTGVRDCLFKMVSFVVLEVVYYPQSIQDVYRKGKVGVKVV